MAISLLCRTVAAGCRAERKDVDGDGAAEIVLENDRVRLVFAPKEGGRAESFLYKPADLELVPQGHGVFNDREYSRPADNSEMLGPYTAQIFKSTPKEAAVRLSGRGKVPELEFVEFSKTVRVRQGSSAVEAEYEISNLPGSEKALPIRPWFRHELKRWGNGDRWYLPSASGIRVVSPGSQENSFWEYRPAAGWLAMVSASGRGLAAVFDYPDVHCLCGWVDKGGVSTLEWRLRTLMVREAEGHEHRVTLIPFRGLSHIDGARPAMLGAFALPEELGAGETVPLRASLFAPSTLSALSIRLKHRHLTDGLWHRLPPQRTDLAADQTAVVDFGEIELREGTTVVRLEAWHGPDRLFWMERPLIAGEPTPDYRLRGTLSRTSDGNLLANGSFEQKLDSQHREGVQNWFHRMAVKGWDDSRCHSGDRSFHTSRGPRKGAAISLSQVVALEPGKYVLTGYCLCSTGCRAAIRVTFTGRQNTPAAEPISLRTEAPANRWHPVEHTLVAPPGTARTRIELLAEGSVEAWWDDLRLAPYEPKVRADGGEVDIPYRSDVVTPHVRWAKPLAGGKLKALLLIGVSAGREVIELAQRVDLDFETVTTSPNPKHAKYASLALKRRGYSQNRIRSRIEQQLKRPYDVIVIGAISGELFTEAAHELLTKSVERGTGLVWVMPIRLPKELRKTGDNLEAGDLGDGEALEWVPAPTFVEKDRWSLLPFDGVRGIPEPMSGWRSRSDHFITRGIPFRELPPTRHFSYEVSGKQIAEIGDDALIAVGQYGGGRTVCLNYQAITAIGGKTVQSPKLLRDRDLYSAGFTPKERPRGFFESVRFPYWEYHLGLVARCILWAAKREPATSLAKVSPSKSSYSVGETPQVRIKLRGSSPRGQLEIRTYAETTRTSTVQKQEVRSPDPQGTVTLDLEGSRTPGRHFCDVILRDAAGNSLDWATAVFRIEAPVTIEALEMSDKIWKLREPVTARVSLSAAPTANMTLNWAAEDQYGRRIDERTAPAKVEMEVAVDVSRSLTRRFRLVVDLLNGNALWDRAEAWGVCALPSEPWRDFQFVMSHTIRSRAYLLPALARQYRAMGITAVRGFECEEDFCRLHNFGLIGSSTGVEEHPEIQVRTIDGQDYQLRALCLNDPATQRSLYGQAARRARELFQYGAIAVGLGDESTLGGRERREVCFSDHCLAELRKWLQGQYADLEALNKEWDTAFESWEEVRPMLSKEVLKDEFRKRNYAPWADHREFMDLTFARFHKRMLAHMQEGYPAIRMGMSGTQKAEVYYGTDWWLLSWAQNYVQAYTVGDQHEMRRSFQRPSVARAPAALRADPRPPQDTDAPGLVGYAWTGYGGAGAGVLRKPFYYLFHGLDSGYWKVSLAVNPDLTLSKSGADYAKACRPLLTGLGRLIKAYERTHDGIALHYSQASLRVATIERWNRAFDKNRQTWVKVIERLGYQYHFISYEQLERGELSADEYRVLILPQSTALSEREIAALRSFVEKGGTVVADGLPGVFDGHCRGRETSPLANLFGVATGKEPGEAAKEIVLKDGLGAERLPLSPLDPALRSGGATALGASGEVPVLLEKAAGTGRAVCLNYAPNAGVESLRVLDHLFQRAGVVRRADLTDANGERRLGAEQFLYRAGDNWLFGALLPGNRPPQLSVTLPAEGYVYDPLQGSALSRGRQVRVPAPESGALLLAQIPYEVKALRLDAPETAVAGEDVALTASLEAAAPTGLHVFRLEVFEPGGQPVRAYCRNLDAPAGKVTVKIPLALSDAPGVWRVAVRDVISGAVAEGTVRVGMPRTAP